MLPSIFWGSLCVVPVFILLSIFLGAASLRVARRRGWPSWPALGAGITLAAALAMTLTPVEWDTTERVTCLIAIPETLGLLSLPALTQSSLNALLLMPFGFFSALASRRPWIAILPVVMVPVCIELIQGLVPVINRTCNTQDIVDNITGGLLGIALGALVLRVTSTGK